MDRNRTVRTQLAFLGGGNMAEALLKGLIQRKTYRAQDIIVSDVSAKRLLFLRENYGVRTTESNAQAADAAATLIVAVKPGQVAQVLEESKLQGKLVISIAAGVKLSALQKAAPGARCVRVMPNTPSLVGEGMSALFSGAAVTATERKRVLGIFASVGRAIEVNSESLLDAVTGLSGSGPAFVFLFIEALADGGVAAGLPRVTAMELAVQTVIGSAKLALESGKHPGELKDMVTSPGGTTIAGVTVLEESAFRGAVLRAVKAAADRSRELGT